MRTSEIFDLLRDGRLQALSDKRMAAANQFYLLTKAEAPLSAAADIFVRWILDQANA